MKDRAGIFAWIEARFEDVHWGEESNGSEEVVEFLDSAFCISINDAIE